MTAAAKRKGSAAEREAVALLSQWWPEVGRAYGAGRQHDVGDVLGVPDTCLQVKSYTNVAEAITRGLLVIERQREAAGCRFGAVLVRRRGGRFVAVMDLAPWAELVRAATHHQ